MRIDEPFAHGAARSKAVAPSDLASGRKPKLFVCGFAGCDYSVDRQVKLENHHRTHTGERPFACPHEGCDKAYARKDKLKHHIQYGHGEDAPRRYPCTWPGCKKSYGTKQHLDVHINAHEKKFYCTGYGECDGVFRKQKTLDEHIALKHLQMKPYPCSFVDPKTGERCTRAYESDCALRSHVLNNHFQQRFFCELCPAPGSGFVSVQTEHGLVQRPMECLCFDSATERSAHQRECHPPACPECGKQFGNLSSLETHLTDVHGPGDQIACPRPGCTSIFKSVRNLNAHIAGVHEKTKQFVCTSTAFAGSKKPELAAWNGADACGAAYASKHNLEQHVRREHLHTMNRKQMRRAAKARAKAPPKPEPTTLQLLTGHGHDEGKTISCTERGCEYRFFRDYDLRRHLASVHQMAESEIGERILERNALEGGEFWFSGAGDVVFEDEDAEMEMDETPVTNGSPVTPSDANQGAFQPGAFAAMKDSVMQDADEAELDKLMGLGMLQTWNMHNGLPRT